VLLKVLKILLAKSLSIIKIECRWIHKVLHEHILIVISPIPLILHVIT